GSSEARALAFPRAPSARRSAEPSRLIHDDTRTNPTPFWDCGEKPRASRVPAVKTEPKSPSAHREKSARRSPPKCPRQSTPPHVAPSANAGSTPLESENLQSRITHHVSRHTFHSRTSCGN